jgi:hypothetical protein
MRITNGPTNAELIEYFAALGRDDRERILINTGVEPFLFAGVIEDFLAERANSEQVDPELELLKAAAERRTKTARKKSTIYANWLATILKARAAGYSYDMLVQFINAKQTRYRISKSYLYHLLQPFNGIIQRMRDDGYQPTAEEIERITAGKIDEGR